jgi:hypothetical protein
VAECRLGGGYLRVVRTWTLCKLLLLLLLVLLLLLLLL